MAHLGHAFPVLLYSSAQLSTLRSENPRNSSLEKQSVSYFTNFECLFGRKLNLFLGFCLKMGTGDEVVEIESLERSLLSESVTGGEETETDDEPVLYTASFGEMEENFVKYQTTQWVLYSLVLILAWGIGLIMLLYIPVRRYILRRDIRSRKLYLTPNSIVYEVNFHPFSSFLFL